VAAGGRVERKSRIGDYELANHAPIQEVCRHKRGLGDFIGESRANASFSLGTYLTLALALCTVRIPKRNSCPIRRQNQAVKRTLSLRNLHLTFDWNSIKLRRAIVKCRSIIPLDTPKLAAGFPRNISG